MLSKELNQTFIDHYESTPDPEETNLETKFCAYPCAHRSMQFSNAITSLKRNPLVVGYLTFRMYLKLKELVEDILFIYVN